MIDFHRIEVLDSHTGGEPTRLVLESNLELGDGSLAEKAARFNELHSRFRERVLLEPRGSEILVGALLLPPDDPACAAAVIFFNNSGVLGMCGHGTIGVAVSLGHLGELQPGEHQFETPAGIVAIQLHDEHRVTVRNVPSYRFAPNVAVDVPGIGLIHGDVAYGGNWFFLTDAPAAPIDREHADELAARCRAIRAALQRQGVAGADGAVVDHIGIYGPPSDPRNHSRNFMLCPGGAWDRSPCGTGTSAKIACLAVTGDLQPGEVWRQESTTGSVFEASYELLDDESIAPSITGTAHMIAEATLLFDPADD